MKGGVTHKLCQNANFENWGTTIHHDSLHVLLNNFSISLLSKVHETSGYFEMKKDQSCHFFFVLKKINKIQVAG